VTAIKQIWTILKKDLILELRTREMLISMFLFVMLTMVIFNYSFSADRNDLTAFGGGLLWIAFIFTALLGLNRSFAHEKEGGCLDGLLLSPIDRSLIYTAKVLSIFIFLSIIQIITIPIFTIFFIKYNYSPMIVLFILGIFLGNLGIASIGTFITTLAINTKRRDLLVPILGLPLMMPILWLAVTISGNIMAGPLGPNTLKEVVRAVQILALFDIVYFVASYGLYDFVIGE